MPLREDLLQPIPGENPSGKNLRYERVYDQVKEARTEDDETLPAGAWERQAKRADFNLVIKLAGEALATRSKDLQLAAWLGEAHIKKEGAAMLSPVLTLMANLQKEFWDTIYPEIDDGDVGLRAVPLQWAANRYATLVYEFPLTKNGVSYFNYKAARALGYAADAQNNDSKKKERDLALKRGQLTAEDLDESLAASPKSFYAGLDPVLQEARDVLEDLALYCEGSYGDDGPSFRKLRDSLEEVHNTVNSLLSEKRKAEPDPVAVAVAEPEPEPVVSAPAAVAPAPVAAPVPAAPTAAAPAAVAPVATAPPAAAAAGHAAGGPPASWEDATARVQACALYMSSQRPGSSVPYLLHSSIRWGEIRKHAPKPPLDLLVPPSAEIRSGLKLASSENNWSVVLTTAMNAMAEPCARCWMDVHRYLWRATSEMGYAAFSGAVVTAVQGLLKDFPEIASWTFADDTPVANAETIKWLEDKVQTSAPAAAIAVAAAPVALMPQPSGGGADNAIGSSGDPEVFAEAASLAARGDLNGATVLLSQDAIRQTSGRMRYRRRVEIAELCLSAGSPAVAAPILRELVAEIERRSLDTWETGEMVAKPVALLLRSMNGDRSGAEWEANFARLCRLDPAAALEISPAK